MPGSHSACGRAEPPGRRRLQRPRSVCKPYERLTQGRMRLVVAFWLRLGYQADRRMSFEEAFGAETSIPGRRSRADRWRAGAPLRAGERTDAVHVRHESADGQPGEVHRL